MHVLHYNIRQGQIGSLEVVNSVHCNTGKDQRGPREIVYRRMDAHCEYSLAY